MNLFQRIKFLAKNIAGSESKLALTLSIPQRTLNGYLSPARQDNLWPILPKILDKFPQINRNWLYFGEGEMLSDGKPPALVLAKNRQKKLLGDLLGVALNAARLSFAETAQRTGIDETTLQSLLQSRTPPTFEQLETLYLELSINPAFFFDSDEEQIWKKLTAQQPENMASSTGMIQSHPAHLAVIERLNAIIERLSRELEQVKEERVRLMRELLDIQRENMEFLRNRNDDQSKKNFSLNRSASNFASGIPTSQQTDNS